MFPVDGGATRTGWGMPSAISRSRSPWISGALLSTSLERRCDDRDSRRLAHLLAEYPDSPLAQTVADLRPNALPSFPSSKAGCTGACGLQGMAPFPEKLDEAGRGRSARDYCTRGRGSRVHLPALNTAIAVHVHSSASSCAATHLTASV